MGHQIHLSCSVLFDKIEWWKLKNKYLKINVKYFKLKNYLIKYKCWSIETDWNTQQAKFKYNLYIQ